MKRLLIANRGEIARRIIRTAHRMGIETVAVYSDADAHALHVREATLAFALGGNTPAESYLRIERIVEAVRETGADAVHPGYGFLSENAAFAQAVVDAGALWVGPPADAIRTLGSKSRAKQIALARGVPCLPGYHGEDASDERLVAEASDIGFPVMVKAVAGGGGRGMRLARLEAELPAAIQAARSEALSAFGSGELLLERAVLAPRHVEVQVFADMHGNCIHLGERDCSVQRRHQKLIEETPSPAVDEGLRNRMGRCAIELAKAAGYVGAGTVEFLVEDTQFYLMEMNTRLQVEHAVTEMVTGLDLVEWQLRIARGEALPLTQEEVRFSGHAIEARLCAEDEDFMPHAGRVAQFAEGAGVRFDHALFEGLQVPPYYDSMLGKLVAHAPTRAEAIEQLAAALDRTVLVGLANNRRFLAATLRHKTFRSGAALVPFLGEQAGAIRAALAAEEMAVVGAAGRAVLLPEGGARELPSPFTRPARLRHRGSAIDLRLREDESPRIAPRGGPLHKARLADGRWHVQVGSVDLFVEDASFEPPAARRSAAAAGELRAPFNGKVIAIRTRPGTKVAKGETLLVIESMKLEHSLAALRDGVVKGVHVEAGQQAATFQLLVSFEGAP